MEQPTLPAPEAPDPPPATEIQSSLTAETLLRWGPALEDDPQPFHTLRMPLPEQLDSSLAAFAATVMDGASDVPVDGPGASVAHEGVRLRLQGLPGPPPAAAGEDPADYVVRAEIGAGGMGTIYLASQPALQREVALKLIQPHLARRRGIRSRFVEEALCTGQLDHPSIVTVHQLGRTHDGQLVLSMRRVRGESLRELLAREPADSPERLRRYLDVLIKVSDAIAYAHSQGVLHRDLKPANVMVGAFGEVQVMDWGLGLRWAEEGGEAEGPAGTPAYMAPEQAMDERARFGPTLDVFGLGAILYEVLCGSPPYQGGSALQVLARACDGEVQDPRTRAPGRELPADLVAHCLASLEPDPGRRVPDAGAFKAGLERFLVHAAAMRLLERARAELAAAAEGGEAAAHRAHRLERAEGLLGQALEVWPDSGEARELLRRTRFARADLALDREAPQDALELASELDGAEVDALRQAARRQLGRRRNQALVAVLLGVLATGGYALWEYTLASRRDAQRERLAAQRELPEAVAQAWRLLALQRSGVERAAALEAVRKAARGTGWSEARHPWLTLANVVESLRAGDRGVAVAELAQGLRGTPGDVLLAYREEAPSRVPPLAIAKKWRDSAAEFRVEWSSAVGEAALLADASPRDAVEGQALARYLWDLGAVGPLLDPRAGVRPRWLDPALPTLSLVRDTQRQRAYLLALDPRTGEERWRFPSAPRLQGVRRDGITPPLVLRRADGRAVVAVGLITELFFLDLASGQPLERLRARSWIGALLPAGRPGELLVVQRPGERGTGDGRARAVPASLARGWLETPGSGSGTALTFPFTELLGRVGEALDPLAAEGVALPLATQLGAVAGIAARDPTLPLLPLVEARLAWLAGERARAHAAVDALLARDLTAWELASAAQSLAQLALALQTGAPEDRLLGLPGLETGERPLPAAERSAARARGAGEVTGELWAEVDRLLEAAVRERGARRADAGASPGRKLASAANVARLIARDAQRAGEMARAGRYLRLSLTLSAHLEGDAVFLEGELGWLRAHGVEVGWAEPYRADAWQFGAYLIPHSLLQLADAVVLFVGVMPWVLLGVVITLVARTHTARAADLHALGFRSRASRWLAFLTHPFLRGSRTFLAYSTRGERALLLLGSALLLGSFLYITAIVQAVDRARALPGDLLRGEVGHPQAAGYLRATLEEGRAPRDCLRLLAEGAQQNDDDEDAARWLARLERRFPGDAFALHGQAYLAERRGDPDAARRGYAAAARSADPNVAAVGAWNLARLEGRPAPALPPAYAAAAAASEPPRALPVLAGGAALRRALGLPSAALALLGDHLADALAGRTQWIDPEAYRTIAGYYFEGLPKAWRWVVAAEAYFGASAVLPLLLLLVAAEVHLPFGTRGRGERTRPRWLERVGLAIDVLWPGARWISRGQLVRGTLACLGVGALFLLAQVSRVGSTLVRAGLEGFSYIGGEHFDATALIAPWVRALGYLAWVALAAIYLATWVSVGRTLRGGVSGAGTARGGHQGA
ncbi:MAG: protein kinase [Planctomycetota bacterium]